MTMDGDDCGFGFVWECVLAAVAVIALAVAVAIAALFLA